MLLACVAVSGEYQNQIVVREPAIGYACYDLMLLTALVEGVTYLWVRLSVVDWSRSSSVFNLFRDSNNLATFFVL
jgi:hypothetical protein